MTDPSSRKPCANSPRSRATWGSSAHGLPIHAAQAFPAPAVPLGPSMPVADAVAVVLDLIANAGFADYAVRTYRNILGQFSSYAPAVGVERIDAVDSAVALNFVEAPVPGGGAPAYDTMRLRRASVRLLYRVLRVYLPDLTDPTADIYLPVDRDITVDRPLTNGELAAARAATGPGIGRSSGPAIFALALAGAAGEEIIDIRVVDVNLQARTVAAPGTRRAYPRVLRFDDWARDALALHIDTVRDHPSGLLVTPRADNSTRRSSRAAVHHVIRSTLTTINLWGTPAIGGRSVQHTGARLIFDATGRIEDAAHLLGVRSLDRAAEAIGHDWCSERGGP